MNWCRVSLLDSYVGAGAVLSWLKNSPGQHATARGYVPPTAQLKADASSPWARQWCAGPVNGTWSMRSCQSCWCFCWKDVWWFLMNLFFVLNMVLGLLLANSFFMYTHSFTWNCFHSFISTGFLCFDWKASSPHGVMVHWCAALLGMFVGETNLPVPWHQIHDSLRASTAASQDFLQGDG